MTRDAIATRPRLNLLCTNGKLFGHKQQMQPVILRVFHRGMFEKLVFPKTLLLRNSAKTASDHVNHIGNPFAPAQTVDEDRGIFGDARLIKSSFLYRVIEIDRASLASDGVLKAGEETADHTTAVPEISSGDGVRIVYTGWWFLQRVYVQGTLCWSAVSWLSLRRAIDLTVPSRIFDNRSENADLRIEITFGTALQIQRFRLWIASRLHYDEIN